VEIAEALYQMEHAHEFDELVVVAPPKMLGDLRAALHPEVTQCIVAEVAKDLTGHPIPDLVRVLS
jgi:protein required for attachment to host cells